VRRLARRRHFFVWSARKPLERGGSARRRVLELGGYAREFFVSQTPELTAMADAVIDLEVMAG
jgi:hypothetical protein